MSDLSVCIVSVLKNTDGKSNSVGMGFLLSDSQMMTCTHVIMSALGINDASKLKQAKVAIEIGVCTSGKRVVEAQVTVVHPMSKNGGDHELEDICLLVFDELLDVSFSNGLFSNYPTQAKVQMFGFGEADSNSKQEHQATLNRGRWVDGQCKGPNRDWEQINTAEREVLRGFSGGPVFNHNRSKILGMLVARDVGENIAHMIPASLLSHELPSEHSEVQPLVSVLSRVLDRKDQSAVLESYSNSSICRCFVVECTDGDAPELFAHKIKALAHMHKRGLKELSKEAIEPVNFIYSPGGQGFFEMLEYEVEEDIVNWLKKDNQLKVVFVSSSDGRNVVQQIERILAGINRLNAELREQKNLASCMIIVPFYRDQFSWFTAKLAQFQLGKLEKLELIQLPKLGEISGHHLSTFVLELPKKARKDFEEKFDANDINQDFYQYMKENNVKKYRDIKSEFEKILQNRMQG